MRSDMAKVIVERPRCGDTHAYREVRAARKHDLSEEAPLRESMKRPHITEYRGKQLNENLAPLRRFLSSQVGRPWDHVYRDLNEHVKVTSPVQLHIREHLHGYVYLHTFRDENGVVCHNESWRGTQPLSVGDLYVNDAGILTRLRSQPKQRRPKGVKVYAIYRVPCKRKNFTDHLTGDRILVYDILVAHEDKVPHWIPKEDVLYYFEAASHTVALQEPKQVGSWHREKRIKVNPPRALG